MAKNYDNPEERQQRPRRQHDQPQINVEVQGRASADFKPLAFARQSPSARLILHQLSHYR
jgi:hypothetical protein